MHIVCVTPFRAYFRLNLYLLLLLSLLLLSRYVKLRLLVFAVAVNEYYPLQVET